MTKICRDCNEEKSIDSFYKMKRGDLKAGFTMCSYCKECWGERYSHWGDKNKMSFKQLDKHRKTDKEYQRIKRAENPERKSEENEVYNRENPNRIKANSILNVAIKKGEIKRSLCRDCDRTDTHGHHEDYSKPLEVKWLCPVHHKKLHQVALKELKLNKYG